MNFADAIPAAAILAVCFACAALDWFKSECRTSPAALDGHRHSPRAGGATVRGECRGTASPRTGVRERIGGTWL